jgi:hypothetical protein
VLISRRYKFIFLSNPKCASTTILSEWKHYSQFVIQATALGKHLSCRQVRKYLEFVFQRTELPMEAFFRFGVIRDPVDKQISWFNYATRKRAAPPSKSQALEEFQAHIDDLTNKMRKKRRQAYGQYAFYSEPSGDIGVDYLIAFPNLADHLPRLRQALGIKPIRVGAKSFTNISPKILTSNDLSDQTRGTIRDLYSADVGLYERALSGGFDTPENAVAKKLGRDEAAR